MKKLFTSESVSEGHPDNDYSQERWVPVIGYEGRYDVSDYGRVRSHDITRLLVFPKRNLTLVRIQKGRILKPHLLNGYPCVMLTDGKGKRERFLIHRLVASYFVDGYKEGLQVNHKDESRDNNYYKNLEWVTCKQNINHGTHNIRMAMTKGKRVGQFTLDGQLVNTFFGIAEACRQTGICRENIGKCCLHRKKWRTAGGYKWEFV